MLRTALIQVESTEANWNDNFAKPLLAKRHQVDSGDSTVSDLQIFYLRKIPLPAYQIERATRSDFDGIKKNFADATKSAERAAIGASVLPPLAPCSPWSWDSSSPSTPRKIHHPAAAAPDHRSREIGDSGDLNQNIDIHRTTKSVIWPLLSTISCLPPRNGWRFHAVAEGDLSVEVVPRSKRDTLGQCFPAHVARPTGNRSHHRDSADRFLPAPIRLPEPPTNRQGHVQAPQRLKKSPAPCTK